MVVAADAARPPVAFRGDLAALEATGDQMVALGGASFVFGVVSWIARIDSWVDLTVWAVLLLAGMAYVVVRASNAARAVHRR